MPPFGVMEIFYGLAWLTSDRESYASFLKEIGFQFYLYGPKADESLRRNWHTRLNSDELKFYANLRSAFHGKGLKFGMALSPQGLQGAFGRDVRAKLQDKVKALDDLGIDMLGLFFDDMRSFPGMADRQLEIIRLVRENTKAQLLFCPSYYCYDSLLDFLFGERPPGYLETLGAHVPADVEILWTGEQIISAEVTGQHLKEVSKILKRKPFICDNFFANDGPINCHYLRVLPPRGRKREMVEHANGWAFNPMNQASLSKLVLMAFSKYMLKGIDPDKAFEGALRDLCSPWLAEVLLSRHKAFAESGLDGVSPEEQLKLRQALSAKSGGVDRDILQWLDGRYAVGMEALLNQSCYDKV